jgi:hypothetical protein
MCDQADIKEFLINKPGVISITHLQPKNLISVHKTWWMALTQKKGDGTRCAEL